MEVSRWLIMNKSALSSDLRAAGRDSVVHLLRFHAYPSHDNEI